MEGERLEILTERLRLRQLEAGDAPRLSATGGLPEVARMMLSFRAPWPEPEVQAWIAAARFEGRMGFRLAITERQGGELVGVIGLAGDPATMMYFIADDRAGRGYATEAARGFLAWAFPRFGLAEIHADHFDDNPASGRILRKLGFVECGRGRHVNPVRLEPAPVTLYRLSRTEFEAAPCNS